jgi:hypothetical protein
MHSSFDGCLLLAGIRNNQALETDIVQACGGMPLALEIAGGHLGMNCTYMDWKVSPCPVPRFAHCFHERMQECRPHASDSVLYCSCLCCAYTPITCECVHTGSRRDTVFIRTF